ncbi:MAG: hypothetical protein KGS44_01355 [Alphaproteobacteria bacterium]|nr:hypothetical protein [Alphaproteobacteria bacterium]
MRVLAAAACSAFLIGTAAAQTAFLEEAPDMPLPPGSTALAASSLEPAAPGGQHLVFLIGAEGPAATPLAFYAETLPGLGWTPAGRAETALFYVRGRDQLVLRLLDGGTAEGRVTLLIELVSSPASQALD